MFVLGLTGSIGMGKSTTSALFRKAGVPVHDSDAAVHALYAGAAAPLVERAFPGVTHDGIVDRALLAARVRNDPQAMARLEAIIHPLVRADRAAFVRAAAGRGEKIVVLDVPLLFETGADRECDATVVVSAPEDVQKARVVRPSGHDAGVACGHNVEADARFGKAAAGAVRHRYEPRPRRRRAAGARRAARPRGRGGPGAILGRLGS